MKLSTVCTTLAASLTLVLAGAASGQTITQWNFNSVPPDASTTTGTLAPSTGAGTAIAIGGATATFASGAGSADPVTTDDTALSLSPFPATSAASGTAGAQFSASTVGSTGVRVSYDQRNTNTASGWWRFEYSTDGTTFVTTGLPGGGQYQFPSTSGGNFAGLREWDLTGVTGVDNNPNFKFRIVSIFDPAGTAYAATGATSTYSGSSGNIRLDYVTVSGSAVGACCVNGVCIGEVVQTGCTGAGSSWGGPNTVCASFMCPEPTGACCVGSVCTANVAQSQCAGVFRLNTACAADTCPPTGACCVGNACSIQVSTDCDTQSGVFLGRNTTCAAGSCDRASGANLVAKFDFDVNTTGGGSRNLTFTQSLSGPFAGGVLFGEAQRYTYPSPPGLPFSIADDSSSLFPGDTAGIVREDKLDSFFGVVNLVALVPNAADRATATWTFDVTGYSNLSLSVDLAAMGDFETELGCSTNFLDPPQTCIPDVYVFSASIDGGAPQQLFRIEVQRDAVTGMDTGMLTYTLADGDTFTLDDPLLVNGATTLNNVFQTLTAAIAGTGSTLAITLSAQSEGTGEAFAFDNLVISGTTGTGGTGSCCLANNSCSVTTESACIGGTFTAGGACGPSACTPPCRADFNASGAVDVSDIFSFLSAWFAQAPGSDFNGSGATDVADIFAFLSAWFAGCP